MSENENGNREPRILDIEVSNQLTATVASLRVLTQEMSERKWEITPGDIVWIETDLFLLKEVLEKMGYTYYVE